MSNNVKTGNYVEGDYFYWDVKSAIPEGTTHIRVKADVKEISNNAFKDNLELECIDFLNYNLERIGDYAFYGCKSLRTIINLKDEVTKIGLCAFKILLMKIGVLLLKVFLKLKQKQLSISSAQIRINSPERLMIK